MLHVSQCCGGGCGVVHRIVPVVWCEFWHCVAGHEGVAAHEVAVRGRLSPPVNLFMR